jgi:choice-of-anchor C domain-containing protein
MAAATAALGASPALAAGSLTNGNFESGTYTGTAAAGFETLTAGTATASAMTGWTVTSGSVDWISTYWQEPAGVTNSIDMNGTASAAQPSPVGVLSQQFATDVNATYVVQFQLAGNPVCGPSTYGVSLTATGGTAQPYTVNTSGTSTGNMGWTTANAYSFVATSDTTTLTFAADPGNTSDCGAAIAGVTATETAATGAQCKDGGWRTMFEPSGTPFKNQGDCVSYYATTGQTPIGS